MKYRTLGGSALLVLSLTACGGGSGDGQSAQTNTPPIEAPITLEGAADTGATFVLGSAVPHPYPLHLGSYSVHTSADALEAGEEYIRELKQRLNAAGNRHTQRGSTPVYRG